MRSVRTLSRGLAVLTAGLFSVSLVAALAHSPTEQPNGAPRAAPPQPVVPLFAKTAPAKNPTELVLLPDESGVRGWVAGAKSFAGAKVSAKTGKAEHTATVSDDNTFAVPLTSAKAQAVTVTVTPPQGNALTGRTTVPAKADKNRRVAFVISDRSAYRPGHTLKFAAYVHDTADGITFKPVANTEFTVDVTSETRGTRAARLKLRTDAEGRLSGQYTFTDADALDHYQIAIQGAEPSGLGRVLLGEYRKTKVGVKLKGEVKDGKLVLTFDARDYLDRPVKGSSATWSATVTKEADAAKLALDPFAFVAHEGGPPSIDDFNALPDDERLLTLAHGVSSVSFAGFGARTVATREGKAQFGPNDAPTVSVDLWPEWTKGQHSVTVTGTFIDETGRENRASGTFSLTPAGAKAVRVSTPKELFSTGEKVAVALTPVGLGEKDAPNTTLLLVRLESNPASPWFTPQFGAGEIDPDDIDTTLPDNTRLPALGAPAKKPVPADAQGWKAQPVFDPVKRVIASAVPVTNGAAEVTLRQPGAYKLLAITRLADGTTLQSETGIVCRAPAKLPGIALQLDARELPAGGRLGGTVHTRFAGARVLLVLRDAGGAKFTRALTAGANGAARFDEALPPNLSYGCAVTAHYVEAAATVHSAMRELFVIPTDRTLTVSTSTPDTVGPGAEVKLNFQVNRQEQVDLVVSVFDESLMGVSGDLSKAIRDFYLADTRGHGRAARDLTAARFGGVSISDLVKKGEALLKDQQALAREPALQPQLTALRDNWKKGELNAADAVALVRLAGFEVYLSQQISPQYGIVWKVSKGARLADLLRRDGLGEGEANERARFYISATAIDNVVLLGLADRNGLDPWAGHRGHFGFAGQFGSFCGGFNCNGFANFGQFGFSGSFGFGGPRYGFGGFGGFGGGFGGGGFGGIGGGFGGVPGGNMGYSAPGGQMGMSFGFNRDFSGGVPGAVSAGGPLPGLGIGEGTVRRDFADSAFWSASLRTDKTGKATATFKVPDSLTNWRVQVVAVSPKLHVGTATTKFKTSRPVMIWPMLPRAFAEGDTVSVFGTVHNLTDQEQNVRVRMTAENGSVLSAPERTVKVPANGSVPVYWQYRAGKPGFTDLLMSAKCDAGEDASLKKLPVVAATVAERVTASGLIDKGELKVELPAGFDAKRASVSVTVAPTLAADLADTLPYLVEYPYGCVEQTMSRFLPAIRVAAILKQAGISTVKELESKLPKVVEAGQKRLIELQHPDGGWGWQGNGQTHEMMTPYALFGLLAAEDAGYPCPNPATIDRGVARLNGYLEQMGNVWDAALRQPVPMERMPATPSVANDALFCLWVLAPEKAAAEKRGIDMNRWLTRIDKSSHLMSDVGHALALELAAKHGYRLVADKLAKALRERAQKSGDRVFWTKAGFSRWGDNTIEVTATVMKALVAHDPKDPLIPGAIAFFHSTKRGDRWDSTKDTAHVLYALCDYLAATQAGPAASGEVNVALNGTALGAVKLDGPASKVLKASGEKLKPGANAFKVSGPKVAGGALVRVSVTFTRTDGAHTPARDHGVKVERTVSVREADGSWRALKSGDAVPVGSYLKVRVTATPVANDLRYFLIESPKPASGETIPATDPRFPTPPEGTRHVLREDRESMTCYHYEQANAAVAEYVVLTEFEGTFALTPARGELMYQPQSGGHSDSFTLVVTPKK